MLILNGLEDICDYCFKCRMVIKGSFGSPNDHKKEAVVKLKAHLDEAIKRRVIYSFDRSLSIHGNSDSKDCLFLSC